MTHDTQGPPGVDKRGVKKTSPMKGKVFFTGDRHTYIAADGHRDSMTESAQWADSVKKGENSIVFFFLSLSQNLWRKVGAWEGEC